MLNLRSYVYLLILIVSANAIVTTGASAAALTVKPTATATVADNSGAHGKLVRLTIGNGARFIECTEDSFSAPVSLTGVEELEVTPIYGSCFANGLTAVPATVTVNGCSYKIQFPGTTSAQASLRCPAGKQLELHIYENETKQKENISLCTYDIAEQGPISGSITLSTDNEGGVNESLTAAISLEKIATTSTIGTKGLCGIAAGIMESSGLKGSATASAAVAGIPWALMMG